MNKILSGVIFIIFGISLFLDSAYLIYNQAVSLDYHGIKTIIYLLLSVPCMIYGYKQIKEYNQA